MGKQADETYCKARQMLLLMQRKDINSWLGARLPFWQWHLY